MIQTLNFITLHSYSIKNVEIKTSLYQKMAKAKKMRLNTFTGSKISLFYKKNTL